MRGRFYCKYEGNRALGMWNCPEQAETVVDRTVRKGWGWREEEHVRRGEQERGTREAVCVEYAA